jgi:periplasmic divalent cation tolerance protein
MPKPTYEIVFMTAASSDEAEKIAEALVEDGLVACVNILSSCRSVYRWKGQLVRDDEALMIAKTRRENFAAIEKRVMEIHSYDVPEIIGVELTSIAGGYRRFLGELLNGPLNEHTKEPMPEDEQQ